MDPWTLRKFAKSLDARIKRAEALEAHFHEAAKTAKPKEYSNYKHTESIWRNEARTLRQLRRELRRTATKAQKALDEGLTTLEGGSRRC